MSRWSDQHETVPDRLTAEAERTRPGFSESRHRRLMDAVRRDGAQRRDATGASAAMLRWRTPLAAAAVVALLGVPAALWFALGEESPPTGRQPPVAADARSDPDASEADWWRMVDRLPVTVSRAAAQVSEAQWSAAKRDAGRLADYLRRHVPIELRDESEPTAQRSRDG